MPRVVCLLMYIVRVYTIINKSEVRTEELVPVNIFSIWMMSNYFLQRNFNLESLFILTKVSYH